MSLVSFFSNRKRVVFLLVAWGIALLPVGLLELGLIWSGWQPADDWRDPYIEITGHKPLFELDEESGIYRIGDDFLTWFRPAEFQAQKPAGSFRVFVVGGSTVQGRPFETETAFPRWLQTAFKANDPQTIIEVVNCGGVSYASYRLSRIVEEIINYDPDLILICTGHNEFLENRTYPRLRSSPVVLWMHNCFSNLRTYRWIRSSVARWRYSEHSRTANRLDPQPITRLDYQNGLDRFHEDELQRDEVEKQFGFHLRRMIATCANRNVPLLILGPPSNQKDCFPFKPTDNWQPGDQSRFADLSIDELLSIKESERTADFHFLYGTRLLESGRFEDAALEFDQAIDRDICPLRMTSGLRRTLQQTWKTARAAHPGSDIFFMDLHQRCRDESANGIIGNELLLDHVHPSIATHQKIAVWICEMLQEEGIISTHDGWRSRFREKVDKQMKELDFGYFERGQKRLQSVLRWSRGQAINPIRD